MSRQKIRGVRSSRQIAVAVGATVRQFDWWVDKGWIKPSPRPVATSGAPRSFPRHEVYIAAVGASLVAAGIKPETAFGAARAVVHQGRGEALLTADVQIVVDPDALAEARKVAEQLGV